MFALTVDVEDWYHGPAITGSKFSKYKTVDDFFGKWTGQYDFLTESTKKVLRLFKKYDVRATFFIVSDVTEHYPGLVEEIVEDGHEIACHGLHHACKINGKTGQPLMSQTEFEERTLKAKSILEKISGQEVIGYRAPSAYIGGWMIDSLERLGFRYDSSVCVNSLYNKTDSTLTGVSTVPYYPKEGELLPGTDKRQIVEFPWAYYQVGGLKIPTGGGPMLRYLGTTICLKGIKQSLKRGDTVFYFHPIDMAEGKFPTGFSIKRPFFWIRKGKSVEKGIEEIIKRMGNNNIKTFKCIFEAKHDF